VWSNENLHKQIIGVRLMTIKGKKALLKKLENDTIALALFSGFCIGLIASNLL